MRLLQQAVDAAISSRLDDHLTDVDCQPLGDELLGHVESLDVGCLLPQLGVWNISLSRQMRQLDNFSQVEAALIDILWHRANKWNKASASCLPPGP